MKLQTKLAHFPLRQTVRLTWTLAGAAAFGKRLERRADAHDAKQGIDILAAIDPLTQRHRGA
jgi:hypothetical protein